MPIKAINKKKTTKGAKSTFKATNGSSKNWITKFNSHIANNATNFGWTKSQVNAFCQAFSAWEKAYNCFQVCGSTFSATPTKKSTSTKSKRVSKTSTAPKATRVKKNNWKKSSSRNWKVAA